MKHNTELNKTIANCALSLYQQSEWTGCPIHTWYFSPPNLPFSHLHQHLWDGDTTVSTSKVYLICIEQLQKQNCTTVKCISPFLSNTHVGSDTGGVGWQGLGKETGKEAGGEAGEEAGEGAGEEAGGEVGEESGEEAGEEAGERQGRSQGRSQGKSSRPWGNRWCWWQFQVHPSKSTYARRQRWECFIEVMAIKVWSV